MKARATCTVSILRGSETNAYDDEVDTETVVDTRVQASIIEQNRRTFLPAENAYRVIRSYACRVGWQIDLRKDDRIRNEQNGRTYLVTDLSEPESLVGRPDITFTASRTN